MPGSVADRIRAMQLRYAEQQEDEEIRQEQQREAAKQERKRRQELRSSQIRFAQKKKENEAMQEKHEQERRKKEQEEMREEQRKARQQQEQAKVRCGKSESAFKVSKAAVSDFITPAKSVKELQNVYSASILHDRNTNSQSISNIEKGVTKVSFLAKGYNSSMTVHVQGDQLSLAAGTVWVPAGKKDRFKVQNMIQRDKVCGSGSLTVHFFCGNLSLPCPHDILYVPTNAGLGGDISSQSAVWNQTDRSVSGSSREALIREREEDRFNDDDDQPYIVLHNEMLDCKAGYAGDDDAICSFRPAVCGEFVGTKAILSEGNHEYAQIQAGIVTDWNNMEKVWHHAFYNELGTVPSLHPVLLTEPPLNSKATREKMAQIMFDTFKVPFLAMCNTASLSLLCSDRSTGVVLFHDGFNFCLAPIYYASILSHAYVREYCMNASTIYECIMKCDVDLQKEFFANIVVSQSAQYRIESINVLEENLQRLAPACMDVKICTSSKVDPWIGGSKFAMLSSATQFFVSKDEYDAEGPGVFQRKCVFG